MNGEERAFLKAQLGVFVDAGISRLGQSGRRVHEYGIDMDDLKASTGRQRVHPGLIEETVEFFASMGVTAVYEPVTQTFDVTVDLDRCKLNAKQANHLVTAQDYNYSQGGE